MFSFSKQIKFSKKFFTKNCAKYEAMNDTMIKLIMIKLQKLKVRLSSWISSIAALTTSLGHLATFQMTCGSGKKNYGNYNTQAKKSRNEIL